jgi:hypothetical protein
MDWIDLAQDRGQRRTCEYDDEPSGSIKCWEVLEWLHNWQLKVLELFNIISISELKGYYGVHFLSVNSKWFCSFSYLETPNFIPTLFTVIVRFCNS